MSVHIIKQVGLRSALAVAVTSALLAGCGSSSSGGGGGGHKIMQNGGIGGSGSASSGGSSDSFEIYKSNGGGDIKLMNGGAANTAFSVATFTPDLGTNPAKILTGTTTPTLYIATAQASGTPCSWMSSGIAATAGQFFMLVGSNGTVDTHLYISDGTTACSTAEQATGLQVASGATLKLPLNASGATWAHLNFLNDVQNSGTITTADTSGSTRGSLDLEGQSYLGTGTLDTSGTATKPNGGSIYLWNNYAMVNSGAVTTQGFDSSTGNGGNAGYLDLESNRYTQNTGTLNARGGNSTFATGSGGNGGNYIELYAGSGAIRNSGLIDGRGGMGDTGGNATNDVYLDAYFGGNWNSGNIWAYGANSKIGNGGSAAYIEFYGYGGDIRNSGDILAYGGDTTAVSGNGGYADYELYVYNQYGNQLNQVTPSGDIVFSGNIDKHGGNAVATGTGSGGTGGYTYVDLEGYGDTASANVMFLGYSEVNTSGGDGNQGGYGQAVYLYNYDNYVSGYYNVPSLAGNIVSELKVDTHGGNAVATGASTNGYGGPGGYIEWETANYATAQLVPNQQKILQTGDIVMTGGQNRNAAGCCGGYSDGLYMFGYNGLTINGQVMANGGADMGTTGGTTGYGSRAYSHSYYSELGVTALNGSVSVNGGDGAYRGGNSNGVTVYGAKITAGNISANGGNAKPSTAGSVGGNGGWLELRATDPANSSAGTITSTGGTGATAGTAGRVINLLACVGTSC